MGRFYGERSAFRRTDALNNKAASVAEMRTGYFYKPDYLISYQAIRFDCIYGDRDAAKN